MGQKPCSLFLTAAVVFAQPAELTGRITDPQGKAVAAASVRLLRGGAQIAEIKTNDVGEYRFFENIASGAYCLTAESPGFSAAGCDVSLPVAHAARVDLQFRGLSAQEQSIVITAEALEPSIDLRNSEVFNRTFVHQTMTRRALTMSTIALIMAISLRGQNAAPSLPFVGCVSSIRRVYPHATDTVVSAIQSAPSVDRLASHEADCSRFEP